MKFNPFRSVRRLANDLFKRKSHKKSPTKIKTDIPVGDVKVTTGTPTGSVDLPTQMNPVGIFVFAETSLKDGSATLTKSLNASPVTDAEQIQGLADLESFSWAYAPLMSSVTLKPVIVFAFAGGVLYLVKKRRSSNRGDDTGRQSSDKGNS